MKDITKDYPRTVAALREAMATFGENFDEFGCFDPDSDIRETSAEAYDGFIPFTSGGLRAMVLNDLRSAYGSGMRGGFEEMTLQPFIDSSLNDAAHDFIRYRDELEALRDECDYENAQALLFDWFEAREEEHNAAHASGTLPGITEPGAFWTTPAGRLREEYYEYESEYMSEGGEFWYEVRANFFAPDNSRNRLGVDEVYIFAGINTDFTYGRDSGLQCSYAKSFPAAVLEANPELIADILADCELSINAEPGQYPLES